MKPIFVNYNKGLKYKWIYGRSPIIATNRDEDRLFAVISKQINLEITDFHNYYVININFYRFKIELEDKHTLWSPSENIFSDTSIIKNKGLFKAQQRAEEFLLECFESIKKDIQDITFNNNVEIEVEKVYKTRYDCKHVLG